MGKENLFVRGSHLAIEISGRTYVQFRDIPQESRDLIADEILPAALRGEKRSLAQDAQELLKPYKVDPRNLEAIPQKGPILIIANHWSGGPLDGLGSNMAISREVANKRIDEAKDIHWIMNGRAFMRVRGMPVPLSDRVIRKIGDTYSIHLVRGNEGIGAGVKIMRDFRRGGLVGLNPEANWTTNLQEGDKNAGSLVSALAYARPDGVISPVGVWSNNSNELNVNFGEPISMAEILKRTHPLPKDKLWRQEVYKRIANYMMKKINPLVPPQYRLAENLTIKFTS